MEKLADISMFESLGSEDMPRSEMSMFNSGAVARLSEIFQDAIVDSMSPNFSKPKSKMTGKQYKFSLRKNPEGKGLDIIATNPDNPMEDSFVVQGSPFTDRAEALQYINRVRSGSTWGDSIEGLVKFENEEVSCE